MTPEPAPAPEQDPEASAEAPAHPPVATVAVAGALALVFVLEVAFSWGELRGTLGSPVKALVLLGGVVHDLVLDRGEWWRLVAGPLLHGDLVHLGLNTLVLLFAGGVLEARLGAARWLVVYGAGATLGAVASAVTNPPTVVSIGASGAGMAVLAAMAVLAFRERVPAVRSAMLVNSLRFLIPSLLPVATSGEAVDLAAHVGGALAGAAVGLVFLKEPASRPFTAPARALAALGLAFTTAGVLVAARELPGPAVDEGHWRMEAAAPWVRRACDAGSTRACVVLGGALATGEALPRDPAAAVALLEGPCASGRESTACFWLGLANSRFEPPRVEAAVAAYERSCGGGDASGCYNLAVLLAQVPGHDAARVRTLLEGACEALPRACAELVVHLLEDPATDPRHAVAVARRACESKEALACWLAGTLTAEGRGVDKDEEQARILHEHACNLGEYRGCNSAGLLWRHGVEGRTDDARATKWFGRACELGKDPVSCTNLAIALHRGLGVEKDEARARALFEEGCGAGHGTACDGLYELVAPGERAGLAPLLERACAAGAGSACRWLGAFAEDGVGREVDLALADRRYAEACEREDADGCAWHAAALRSGAGVGKDAAAAAAFEARACELGLESACR